LNMNHNVELLLKGNIIILRFVRNDHCNAIQKWLLFFYQLLRISIQFSKIYQGEVATIVEVYTLPREGYELEFVGEGGITKALELSSFSVSLFS
jgi:hypothetical protein